MNIRFIFIFIFILFFVSCSHSDQLRSVVPVDNFYVEIIKGRAGLIRTLYCDVLVENVNKKSWLHFSEFQKFKGVGKSFPLEACFLITVYNTWGKPLQIESVRLKYGNNSIEPEYYKKIADKSFPAERYSVNLLNLWKYRRILSKSELIEDIDYDLDTIEYNLEFIAPGDRISSFYMFNYSFGIGEKFTISIVIKYLNMKKVIDFDMICLEHREQFEDKDEYEF